ncbi:hypothetical protein [Thalassospira xiamenensis]|uniref:hypothetical protein n=1 Tax=Thalassospira xiamenensis TaxID=220697 RepID=UPI003AA8F70C
MAVRTLSQFSFDRGEVSPKYAGNADLENYQRSLAICENMVVLPQGMVTRRPGTRFIAEVKDSADTVTFVTFEYSALDTYVLEFGPLYIRFYRDFGQILDGSDAIYEVTTTYTADEIQLFDYEQVGDVLYICIGSKSIATLTRSDHASWTLNASPTFTAKPSEWTGTNWPQRVTLHQQRLCFGSTPAKPRKMWLSMTPDASGPRLLNFTTGTSDENALVFDIVGKGEMQWLDSGRALYLGTTDETRTVSGSGGFYEPITPTSILNRDHANERSSTIKPVTLNNSLFFVSLSGRRVHEFSYAFEDDAFNAPDITKWAEHIAGPGTDAKIVQIAICRDPVPIIWGCRTDGQLIGMTYDRENGVYAWHRHKIGGTFGGNDWGKVESVASVFMGGRDVLFMCVARTIGGTTKRYIECLEDFHNPVDENDISTARYLDSNIAYSEETAQTEFTGAAHLIGEEVEILADGARLPAATVEDVEGDGVITLPNGQSAMEVTIGFNAPFYGQSLPADPGSVQGSGRASAKKVLEAGIDILNTGELKLGKDRETLRDVPFMTTQTLVGDVVPLKTGYEKLEITDYFATDGTFGFGGDGPLPCNIRGFVVEIRTGQ